MKRWLVITTSTGARTPMLEAYNSIDEATGSVIKALAKAECEELREGWPRERVHAVHDEDWLYASLTVEYEDEDDDVTEWYIVESPESPVPGEQTSEQEPGGPGADKAWLLVEAYSCDNVVDGEVPVRAFSTEKEACDCLRRTYIADRIMAGCDHRLSHSAETEPEWLGAMISEGSGGHIMKTWLEVTEVSLLGLPSKGAARPWRQPEAAYAVEFRIPCLGQEEWQDADRFPDEASAEAFAEQEAEGVLREYVDCFAGHDGDSLPYIGRKDGTAVLFGHDGRELCVWRVRRLTEK